MNAKLGKILVVFLAAYLFYSIPCFAAEQQYNIAELSMSINIPEGWDVFLQNIDPSNPKLAEYGINGQEAEEYFKKNNIFLNAICIVPYSEIIVSSPTPGNEYAEEVFDFNLLSNNELNEFVIEATAQEESLDIIDVLGLVYGEHEIYEHNQAKFVRMSAIHNDDDFLVYVEQYYTVINGEPVSITLRSYDQEVSVEQAQTLRAVIDSVSFSKVLKKPSPPLSLPQVVKKVGYGTVIAGIWVGIAALVHRLKKKRNQHTEEPPLV